MARKLRKIGAPVKKSSDLSHVNLSVETLDEVDSTNTYLKENTALLAQDFYSVRALRQTAGRGRQGRSWSMNAQKDLAFSIVVHSRVPAEASSSLTLLAGLATHRVLRGLLPEGLMLKWPNDLHHNGKKIVGILSELVIQEGKPIVVVGIGVNVNGEAYPADLQYPATSLKIETGEEHDPDELAFKILRQLYELVQQQSAPLGEELIAEWKSYSNSIGEKVVIEKGGVEAHAVITDVDVTGALLVKRDGTNESEQYFGEVVFSS